MSNLTTPPAVDTTWPKLHDAIHKAGQTGDLSELRSLLTTESIEVTSDSHRWRNASVLHTASSATLEIVDLLLSSGADHIINARCGPGEDGRWAGHTALQVAAKNESNGIAARLIHAGAEFDVFTAVALGDCERLMQLLDNDPTLLQSTDDYNSTPLHWAAEQGESETVQLLMNRSAKVDAVNDFGETPLLASSACQSNQTRGESRQRSSTTNLLIDAGATRDAATFAAFGDTTSLKSYLAKNPEGATLANRHGTTPLHWAARYAQTAAAKLLLDAGAQVNAADAIGCSPLWYAAYWANDTEMTSVLCRSGADTLMKNIWGKTLLDYDIGRECNTVVLRYRPA